ncbi:MAG: SPOR domain-containing protein [Prevotella sp.]|nr:SPOR domain-containing protein [Prevotella sp.]
MKKLMIVCAGMCMLIAFASCGGSKESAYRKAYEKAKAQEAANSGQGIEEEVTVVAPVVTRPATQNTVVDNGDNVSVRQEAVSVISGAGLRNFSVVVGSFSLKTNAEGLQNTLKSAGYDAQIAYNSERNMYRVIAATYDNKLDAARSRDQFRSQYPDAWLLFAK